MPQTGMWGFQPQQQRPPLPAIQPFLHGQGMMPLPAMGQNFFQHSGTETVPNPGANFIPNPQTFRHTPPPLPVPPVPPPLSQQNINNVNPLSMNLAKTPPPPPPKMAAPPPADFTEQMPTGDWNCSKCHNHNFAWRTSCGRCSEAKNFREGPSKEIHMGGIQENVRGSSWMCPRCNIFNVTGPSHCTQCELKNPNLSDSSCSDFQLRNRSEGERYNKKVSDLTDQERQFDTMFAAWEFDFDSWKRDNQNNPDQVRRKYVILTFEII